MERLGSDDMTSLQAFGFIFLGVMLVLIVLCAIDWWRHRPESLRLPRARTVHQRLARQLVDSGSVRGNRRRR